MNNTGPRIEIHRWYAIVYFDDEVEGVLANTSDGLMHFDSLEAYQAWVDEARMQGPGV
jgi:hypothetical protein